MRLPYKTSEAAAPPLLERALLSNKRIIHATREPLLLHRFA
jgi:hypothetical protein